MYKLCSTHSISNGLITRNMMFLSTAVLIKVICTRSGLIMNHSPKAFLDEIRFTVRRHFPDRHPENFVIYSVIMSRKLPS